MVMTMREKAIHMFMNGTGTVPATNVVQPVLQNQARLRREKKQRLGILKTVQAKLLADRIANARGSLCETLLEYLS